MCQHFQMPAMALLDTDGLYGSPRFHLIANKLGIKAHIGAEVTATLNSPRTHKGPVVNSVSLSSSPPVPGTRTCVA